MLRLNGKHGGVALGEVIALPKALEQVAPKSHDAVNPRSPGCRRDPYGSRGSSLPFMTDSSIVSVIRTLDIVIPLLASRRC